MWWNCVTVVFCFPIFLVTLCHLFEKVVPFVNNPKKKVDKACSRRLQQQRQRKTRQTTATTLHLWWILLEYILELRSLPVHQAFQAGLSLHPVLMYVCLHHFVCVLMSPSRPRLLWKGGLSSQSEYVLEQTINTFFKFFFKSLRFQHNIFWGK